MSEDKAIHTLYERIGHLLFEQPYGELGRYLTYYAEDRLYLVFGLITMYIIIRLTEREGE